METIITRLIEAANAFDTQLFLSKFDSDAVLDDPSVGETFEGHDGIQRYFEAYFIGYETTTKLVKFRKTSENTAHAQVWFVGNFPGNEIGGTFDFSFADAKITHLKADLI